MSARHRYPPRTEFLAPNAAIGTTAWAEKRQLAATWPLRAVRRPGARVERASHRARNCSQIPLKKSIGLAFVLYCTPALRVFRKRFLTPLRVPQAKTRDPVSSYRRVHKVRDTRAIDSEGLRYAPNFLHRSRTSTGPPDSIDSLELAPSRAPRLPSWRSAPGRRGGGLYAAARMLLSGLGGLQYLWRARAGLWASPTPARALAGVCGSPSER